MTEKKSLPEKYDAKTREKFWQNNWKEQGIFAFKNDKEKSETFVIDTPPPTVSGLLHMGHVFSYTQADFVARFQRMSGKDVFYPMGFDDNGLPTERLVEKIIGKKAGVYEHENGHGSFVKKCREEVAAAEEEFEALFNSIALSVDWKQKYQTISPESQKISQASFLDLYKKGLVEKKFEPVFWDISDRTALAQADLIDKEVEGMMNYIEFEVDEGVGKKIEIMTTRPELLPACVAVMVHPEDERYKKFHGQHAITPIFGIRVPIICDELVQLDKGTGAVMCCTFGDETDIKWWKTHSLGEPNVIITESGRTNWAALSKIAAGNTIHLHLDQSKTKSAIEGYHGGEKGRSIKEAKEWVINAFKEQNLTIRQEPIKRAVKCAERSGVPIEILVVPQWFIKVLDKKELLKEKAAECNWYPDYMKVRIDQWIDGLQWDWCISRQRFFGVKFPVWRVRENNDPETEQLVIADVDQLPVDPLQTAPKGYENYVAVQHNDEKGVPYYYTATKGGKKYTIFPETDIMDTWATSSISPQLSSKGISNEISFDKARHEKLFPADLRPQAHEIIRTWAFYTIVKAALHQNSIPWKNLMISGWCLAADKTKMSKSKGNVVTPTALIEEKGSDIVRYWASTSHLGADTAYSEEVFKIGQKLVTKLFNAAKFASMNFELLNCHSERSEESQNVARDLSLTIAKSDCKAQDDKLITETSDLWILSRLQQTVSKATAEFEQFEYARAREAIEEFFWRDFCDNYLEICKVRSYGIAAEKLAGAELNEIQKKEIEAKQQSAIVTLKICLNTLLKLFAPFIPHVCDEIYSTIFVEEFAQTKSINARGNWPKLSEKLFNQKAFEIGQEALAVIFEVRKFKSEKNISMKTTVKKLIVSSKVDLSEISEDLKNVCNAENLEFVNSEKLVEVVL
ncbi:MAG: valine--tRNA ligase [Rickettsiales bacterium]|nr:valine--tRNA ligase [Rickettsiales bacterium]